MTFLMQVDGWLRKVRVVEDIVVKALVVFDAIIESSKP
jgi:hypothetical protein